MVYFLRIVLAGPVSWLHLEILSGSNPILFCLPFLTGSVDASQTSGDHSPHPRAGSAPYVPAAGPRFHPDVALLAVPTLSAVRAPRRADVRGFPRALLPEVRLQGPGPERDHSRAADLHRDAVRRAWPCLHAPQQWLLSLLGHRCSFHYPRCQSRVAWEANSGGEVLSQLLLWV